MAKPCDEPNFAKNMYRHVNYLLSSKSWLITGHFQKDGLKEGRYLYQQMFVLRQKVKKCSCNKRKHDYLATFSTIPSQTFYSVYQNIYKTFAYAVLRLNLDIFTFERA